MKRGGGVIIWACRAATGASSLFVIDNVTADNSYRMISDMYRSILLPQVQLNASKLIGWYFIIRQASDPKLSAVLSFFLTMSQTVCFVNYFGIAWLMSLAVSQPHNCFLHFLWHNSGPHTDKGQEQTPMAIKSLESRYLKIYFTCTKEAIEYT